VLVAQWIAEATGLDQDLRGLGIDAVLFFLAAIVVGRFWGAASGFKRLAAMRKGRWMKSSISTRHEYRDLRMRWSGQ
jgi:hypothetical protein